MKCKPIAGIVVAIVIAALAGYYVANNQNNDQLVTDQPDPNTEDSGIDAADNAIEQREDNTVRIGDLADRVELANLESGDTIASGFELEGQAPGNWFFEATAGYTVVNWDGLIIGESYIEAVDEWMTTDQVDFRGEITYDLPSDTPYTRGTLILARANPRDGVQREFVEIPVNLVPNQ